jgi:molecular chaperone GrpE
MPSSPASDVEPGDGRDVEPGAETSAPAPEQPSEPDDLTRERQHVAELEDRYKRALADLDNLRKRQPRLVEQRVGEVRESMLLDWLAAVDSVERALRLERPDDPASEGMRAVLEQMEQILERQGVHRTGAVGERFDPELHEAISVQPVTDDRPDHAILDVARSGYATGDRVLRPAQVVVARRAAPAS